MRRPSLPYVSRLTRIIRSFETPFARRQRRLAGRVAALRALDDAALAGLGLRRDQIIAPLRRVLWPERPVLPKPRPPLRSDLHSAAAVRQAGRASAAKT